MVSYFLLSFATWLLAISYCSGDEKTHRIREPMENKRGDNTRTLPHRKSSPSKFHQRLSQPAAKSTSPAASFESEAFGDYQPDHSPLSNNATAGGYQLLAAIDFESGLSLKPSSSKVNGNHSAAKTRTSWTKKEFKSVGSTKMGTLQFHRNISGTAEKDTLRIDNIKKVDSKPLLFDFESFEGDGSKIQEKAIRQKTKVKSMDRSRLKYRHGKITVPSSASTPLSPIPVVNNSSMEGDNMTTVLPRNAPVPVTILPSRLRVKPNASIKAKVGNGAGKGMEHSIGDPKTCSPSVALPCSLNFGRNCMLGANEDGCKICKCPRRSPANGCAGPDRLFQSNYLREDMLSGRKKCPNGRRAQRVTRYYRKVSDNGDYCHAIQEVYCGWEVEAKRRMPRSKAQCYFYCFNEKELHELNIKL